MSFADENASFKVELQSSSCGTATKAIRNSIDHCIELSYSLELPIDSGDQDDTALAKDWV